MTVNAKMLTEAISEELTKTELHKIFKNDKDFEKRVKEITSEVVVDMLRVLWQHNGMFKNLLSK